MTTTSTARAAALGRAPTLFILLVGVAIGLLIASLTIPDGATRVVAGEGDLEGVALDEFGQPIEGLSGEEGGSATGGSGGGSTSRGGTASGGGSDPGGSGGSAAGGGSAGGSAAVRGVGDSTIKIGVAIPDIGPFAVVPEFNLGDMRGHFEAILDRWKREGALPVHGRNIEFVYRVFSIIGDEDVASCNGFVKDDQVFMVIGIRSYEGGAECLADRFDTPVVTLEFASPQGEGAYQRMHPYLFTLRASAERSAANFVQWAHEGGHLNGKKIGIYHEPDAEPTFNTVKSRLEAFGYEVAEEATTNRKEGSANDSVAVQRFRSAGIDLVILQVSALAASNFMENANSQAYRPTYIDSDYGDHTSDAASTTHPPAQYDQTLAMTMTRVGEVATTGQLSPPGEACVSNFERYSGRTINRGPPETAEMMVMLQGCDEANIVMSSLQRVGRNLNRATFIAGVDSLDQLVGAFHGSYQFTPQKHHGANSQRTVQWLASCECWTAKNNFGPLWIR